MPFFSRNEKPAPQPQQPIQEPPKRHSSLAGSFFHRNSSPTGRTSTSSSGGSAPNSPELSQSSSGRMRGLLHRGGVLGDDVEMDPSIVRARERLLSAEAAEREADRVVVEARRAVEQASIAVQKLDDEAIEEARRAKLKALHAKDISRRGKDLGRHG